MTPQETTLVLAKCATYDNRQPSQATAVAWHETLDPRITLQEALDIVTRHYQTSREWIMPSDINNAYEQIRLQRINSHGPITPPETLSAPQDARLEVAWRGAYTDAIGSNHPDPHAYAWERINRTPPPIDPPTQHPGLPRHRNTDDKAPNKPAGAQTPTDLYPSMGKPLKTP